MRFILKWFEFASSHANSHIVGGPNRPPSKRMIEQMRVDEQERRQALREGRAPPPQSGPSNEEGYWSSMTRGIQERTERLGIAGDTMDRLEENSSSFASDVGKYVQSQKRKAVFGGKCSSLKQRISNSTPLHDD